MIHSCLRDNIFVSKTKSNNQFFKTLFWFNLQAFNPVQIDATQSVGY